MERKVDGIYRLGQKLKEIRISKHMSLKYVERLSNISAAYLSRLEEGKSKSPTLPVIIKLARAYDVEVIELLKIALKDYGL